MLRGPVLGGVVGMRRRKRLPLPPDGADFGQTLRYYGIHQARVSRALKHLEARARERYGLKPYTDRLAPTVFIGLYYPEDRIAFRTHAAGARFLRPGGSDVRHIRRIGSAADWPPIFAISRDIQARLADLNMRSVFTRWNIVDRRIFRPVPLHEQGTKIYVYNSMRIGSEDNIQKRSRLVYGQDFVDEIVRRRPEWEFIYSNASEPLPNESMPSVYAQYCIGLRLTRHDGTANSVQEFEAMGIPIVHNQSDYGLKWRTVDDIILHIEERMRKKGVSPYPEKVDGTLGSGSSLPKTPWNPTDSWLLR